MNTIGSFNTETRSAYLDATDHAFSTGYVASPDSAAAPMSLQSQLIVHSSVLLPTATIVACFSVVGFGDATYMGLVAYGYNWWAPFVVSGAVTLLLWVLDARHWHSATMRLVRNLGVLGVFVGVGVGCSLATRVYPPAPILFAMLVIPACILLARYFLLRKVPAWRFFLSLSRALLLVAGLNLAVFLLWTLALTPWQRVRREGPVWDPAWSNVWGGDVKDYWRERLGCDPVPLNATAPEAQRDAQRDCYDAAFLWWSMPLLIVLAEGSFAMVIRLLSRALQPAVGNPEAQHARWCKSSAARPVGGRRPVRPAGASQVAARSDESHPVARPELLGSPPPPQQRFRAAPAASFGGVSISTSRHVRLFAGAVGFAFVGIYGAASIAGAGTGLGDVVMIGFVGLLVVACSVVAGSLGWERFAKMLMETPIAKSMSSSASASEWLLALLLLVGALPLLCYLLCKAVHQAVRSALHSRRRVRRGGGGITSLQQQLNSQSPEGGAWFTRGTHQRWEQVRDRHWGSICMKLLLLGVGAPPGGKTPAALPEDSPGRGSARSHGPPSAAGTAGAFGAGKRAGASAARRRPPQRWRVVTSPPAGVLALQVIVMKFVVVFLSCLNLWLAPCETPLVALVLTIVGTLMFLCPIIPGPPIYICCGVVLPYSTMSAAERAATRGPAPPSFWLGVAMACALGFGLKLLAIVLQQEGIGRRLGRSVRVRAACSINSTFMRAARCVLEDPAPLTWGKVAISPDLA